MARYRSRRRSRHSSHHYRPLIGFLLVASFGILFVGCGTPGEIPQADEFSFTAEDVARFRELVGNSTGSLNAPSLDLQRSATGSTEIPVLDLSLADTYGTIRTAGEDGDNTYRVTNEFLNVRSAPNVAAGQLGRLDRGAPVEVVEFVDAAWAKVKYGDGDGYVSNRYISKLVSEEQLAAQKKKYDGLFFVDFGFLNVRREADSQSEKIGELPGQSFVRPLSQDANWARVPMGDKEGYVSTQYLSPFLPNFLVRQTNFDLPILQYRLEAEGALDAFTRHVDRLKQEGYTLQSLRAFYSLLLTQEERDVRVAPKTVVVTIAGITPENVNAVTEALRATGVTATLFLQTQYAGAGGISEQTIATLAANGHDIQSNGHTGDDLRSLTNAQVELELAQSRKLIEQMTGQTVYAISYPIGGVNERVASLAAEAGYLLGVGQASQKTFSRSDLLRLPSFVIRADQSSDQVLQLVGG